MASKTIIVTLSQGLTQQLSAKMISSLSSLDCTVFIQQESKRINAKSILGVISLALQKNDVISLIAEGPDAERALEIVEKYLKA